MTYRERRLAKAARYREWAAKREAKADAAEARFRQISDMIPMGQPVLVGHHSEGRHRRDLSRQDSALAAMVEHRRKAEEFYRRADEIERQAAAATYSDDDDALERLRDRITGLEAERDAIKRFNAEARRTGEATDEMLDALPETWRNKYLTICRVARFQLRGAQFPAYASANLSGNIARLRKRLAPLEAAEAAEIEAEERDDDEEESE